MNDLPPHIEAMIRQLADEGLSVEQIAFMTRIGQKSVRELLGSPRNPEAVYPDWSEGRAKPAKPKPR